MYYLKQKNYDKFKCIAGDCPENCCSFWQIITDDESLARYEKMAEDDIRIKEALNVKEKCLRQTNGSCNFLEPDGYCYLQRTYGESALCDTCRIYPRHVEEFENIREYTLTLSCPEAARMLLTDFAPMDFDQSEDDQEEEFEDFDYILYDKLAEARNKIRSCVQDRNTDICKRLDAILAFGKELQGKLDDDDVFGMDDVGISPAKEYHEIAPETFEPVLEYERLKYISSVMFRLEPLHDDWADILDSLWDNVFSYEGEMEKVRAVIERNTVPAEQILMFFIYTYFCGAVYDGWIYSKIAMAVYSTIWIFCMHYSQIGKDGVTEEYETDSLIKAAWSYARETEHSDINLDLLEEWFMDNM